MKKIIIITIIAVVLGLIAAFFIGYLASDKGWDRLILRIGLSLIVIAAGAAFLWFKSGKVAPATPAPKAPAKASDELEAALREAESKLAGARIEGGGRFDDLPVIFLVGSPGSTKTSSLINSGIEPELLSGQVYQEGHVSPTRLINLWLGAKSIFVEVGSKLFDDPSSWLQIIRRMQPRKISSVVGKKGQAPRAAVVCFDVEAFLRPGGNDASLQAARTMHARLCELSRSLGISTPVYVLFTKADRLSFFHDFVRNLNNEESTQVLGVTLPVVSHTKGVFGEEESARLSGEFNRLFYSLSDKRPEFLSRENDLVNTPGIYEFPREFRKLRSGLVPFLVELCRPSQLTIGPYLRGFYFSGVRPIVIQEAAYAQASQPVVQPSVDPDAGATRIFQRGQGVAVPQPAMVGSSAASRRVPQWIFLGRFFKEVLLADRAAMGAGAANIKTNALRRWLLGAAAALCIFLSIAFLISWRNNRKLESTAIAAANGIVANEGTGSALPSLAALTRLETLRQSLETLTRYDREGAPFSFRWGLYSGEPLYPEVRKLYFSRFQQLLLGPTQQGFVSLLRGLPPAPSPADDYGRPYDTLKAYLITTSNHEKSTRQFLAPLLGQRWAEGKRVDSERQQLAQKQFDFYTNELKFANPLSSENDALAIDRGRKYLARFSGPDRVYNFMISEANKNNPSVNFNRMFAGSAEVVVNNRDVPGAFTKKGWGFMQDAIKNNDRYFNGEPWVLGNQGTQNIDRSNLEPRLTSLYHAAFVAQWREYLRRSSIVKYKDVRDAAQKLSLTSGAQSPLLEMFWLASQNTGVDATDVVKAFRALHTVMPPANIEQYVGQTNSDYMHALVILQTSLEQAVAVAGPPNDAAASQTLANASSARTVTRQMAQTFGVDPEGHLGTTVQQLMEDPITNVEAVLRGVGPAELNGKGKGLCGEMRTLSAKYPFKAGATAEATLADIDHIFKPKEGALWTFYDFSLQKLLTRKGSQYESVPGGTIQLTSAFVGFFNRAAALSDALYAGGTAEPHLVFGLKPIKTEGIDKMTLQMYGQTLTYGGDAATAKSFTWPANPQEVKLTSSGGNLPNYSGLWAISRFFEDADKARTAGTVTTYDWVFRAGKNQTPVTTNSGAPLTVRFDLDMGASPQIFQKGFLSGLGCVSEVAK